MNRTSLKWAALAATLGAAGCASYPDAETTRQLGERVVKVGFASPPALLERLEQDRSQQICSKIGERQLTQAEAAEVVKLARAAMQYPASGRLVGDWKIGN